MDQMNMYGQCDPSMMGGMGMQGQMGGMGMDQQNMGCDMSGQQMGGCDMSQYGCMDGC